MQIDQPQTFGALLKRHRLAAGLSQEQLAERAGLTAQAVSSLERGFRRAPYRDTVRALARVLALTPDAASALDASVARGRAAAGTHDPLGPILPLPPSPLVGREREAAEVEALLHRTAAGAPARLLTLMGPGGVGKTRLALHVARALAPAYADGAVFVALAPLRDPALVIAAIAQALAVGEAAGQSPVAAVCRRLRAMEMLLVLDNFEHVAAAAPVVADLLAACPGLRVLATSRARLRLSGEHVYLVPPLPLPDPAHPQAPAALAAVPAVDLLLQRARAAGAVIVLNDSTAPALAALCRQLDGLPLALELAAPRLAVLSPALLLQRLTAPLRLLTQGPRDLPERQQTLRATLDWSYALVDPAAQAAFRRLSVVPASCALEAAEALCLAGDGDRPASALAGHEVVDVLGTLIDQSLLRREGGITGESRVAMLETVRAFGLERLAEVGEEEWVRHGHARHYLALAEEAERGLGGPRHTVWLARLDQERDNLRAALGWAVDHADAAVALRLVGALWRYWLARGALAEGRAWLHRALDLRTSDGPGDAALRAGALTGAAVLALEQGAGDDAKALATEAVAQARVHGEDGPLIAALNAQGMVARRGGRYADAVAAHEEALARARRRGAWSGVVAALANLGYAASLTGDAERGAALYAEGLATAREAGDTQGVADLLVALAWQAFHRGAYAQVEAQAGEALALVRTLGNGGKTAEVLWQLALVAQQQGALERASVLHAEGLALRRERGDEHGVAQSLSALAQIALHQRDLAEARGLLMESLTLLQHEEARWPRAMSLTLLGHVELAAGDVERAEALLLEGVRTFAAIGNLLYAPWSLEGLAGLAVAQGQPRRAALLLGASAALRRRLGSSLPPVDPVEQAETVAAARAALGEVAFAAAQEEGQALTTEDALAVALERRLDEREEPDDGTPRP